MLGTAREIGFVAAAAVGAWGTGEAKALWPLIRRYFFWNGRTPRKKKNQRPKTAWWFQPFANAKLGELAKRERKKYLPVKWKVVMETPQEKVKGGAMAQFAPSGTKGYWCFWCTLFRP